MVSPVVVAWGQGRNYFLLVSVFYQTLAWTSCCLSSARCALHLLWLYYWRNNLSWFLRFLILNRWLLFHWQLVLYRSLFLRWFLFLLLCLYSWLCFRRTFLGNFRSASANWFLNHGLFYRFRFEFLDRRSVLNWWSSFVNWWFSLSHWRFHASLSLEAFDDFLQGESGLFQIHFKFDGILFWNIDSFFESGLIFLLELRDVIGWINIDSSNIVLFIAIFFSQFEIEKYFPDFVKIGEVEV